MKKLLFPFFVALCVQGKSQVFLEQEPDFITYETKNGWATTYTIDDLSWQQREEMELIGLVSLGPVDSIARYGWWPILIKQQIFSIERILVTENNALVEKRVMFEEPKTELRCMTCSVDGMTAFFFILIILCGIFTIGELVRLSAFASYLAQGAGTVVFLIATIILSSGLKQALAIELAIVVLIFIGICIVHVRIKEGPALLRPRK